ncbi:NACHT, LRR and PYD domains-containing protein 12-like [Alligator mississippiensis]|uniref:NACHT, LRR and PYD domains-containing protein 12-like n=1 Tax=Alligator mississippiensis TaxID=8496 RepID=UPI0028779FC5|nr:NACHT, LRR and PYD domains-containing protein 12-like [Alligator mississippiensis]
MRRGTGRWGHLPEHLCQPSPCPDLSPPCFSLLQVPVLWSRSRLLWGSRCCSQYQPGPTKLDFSGNCSRRDDCVQVLCEGLRQPRCQLETLRLGRFRLPAACCGDLAAALSTSPSLTELDLSYNDDVGAGGVRVLCEGLRHPRCKVQTLRLGRCSLPAACCGDLAAALSTSPSLTELDLSDNRDLGAGGVRVLCEGLRHPRCKVQTLRLQCCHLPAACCGDLAAALSTSPSLTEMDLGGNDDLGAGGVRVLCEGLRHPSCKVQTLRLWSCHLTDACCGDLAAALSTSPSLTELHLGGNSALGAGGVRVLCEGLRHPSCKVQTLGFRRCRLTAACCGDLAAALSTSPSLTELDLSYNGDLGAGGVRVLCEGLRHPRCKVQTLRLGGCRLRCLLWGSCRCSQHQPQPDGAGPE